jgi:hypothetical protein
VDLKNHTVDFRICDIFYPKWEQILFQLHGSDVLQGRVVDLSETGNVDGSFLEVEVEGLSVRLIIPLERILGVCE